MRRALAAVAVVVVAAAGVILVTREPGRQLVVRADPVFNVLYDDDRLRREPEQADEVLRLAGSRPGIELLMTVTPFDLEPYDGDVSSGLLPILADGHRRELEASVPGFDLVEEGRARVREAPGYSLTYAGAGDLEGEDVLVVEGPQAPRGYVLSYRVRGPRKGNRKFIRAGLSAFRSFRFGTERD